MPESSSRIPSVTQPLTGWGRMAPGECTVFRPEKQRTLEAIVEGADTPTLLARGLGRSYGDTAVNTAGGVVRMERLNGMIAFDDGTGTLVSEAGVSLAEIIDVFLPRGFFLPVTPGTKFVTVGGAIANDIHGKNHHRDGTFGDFVDWFDLLTPTGDVLRCSRTENTDAFWATLGGIGLTGFIVAAAVRLQRVPSAYMRVDYRKANNLEDALAAIDAKDDDYQYSVGWTDCLAKGGALGRTVLMRGEHASPEDLDRDRRHMPYHVPRRAKLKVPFEAPGFLINPMFISVFNNLVWSAHKAMDGAIIDYDRYFYPLDRILEWNLLYGRGGFAQYQVTVPKAEYTCLIKLLELLQRERRPVTLAVLKAFGAANDGLLSYPSAGYTLTLDLSNKGDLPSVLRRMDAILLEHGGRIYLAKDVAAEPATVAAMYSKLEQFKAVRSELDPDNRLASSMARRLGIVG